MNKIITTIGLLLFCIVLIADNNKQFSGKYQVSETMKIYGHQDSIIAEYAMEIIQTNDSVYKLININKCSDTIDAMLYRDTLFIIDQVVETTSDYKAFYNGYGFFNNFILTFSFNKFDLRDNSSSILTCIDKKEYNNNFFISNSKKWSVAIKNGSYSEWEYTVNYWYNGFTIINKTIYYYLHKKSFRNFHIYLNDISLWRESDHKLYKLNLSGKEDLVFNNSLESNDTLFYNENTYYIIDSISEEDWGGRIRKHWFMTSNSGNNTSWIEDVGNSKSISGYNDETSDTISELICFEENSELIFQNDEFSDCLVYPASHLVFKNDQNAINLFPTDNGLIHIQLKDNLSGDLSLYTSDGKQVLNRHITKTESNICAPICGLLLFRFENEKGEVKTGKILVR